MVNETLRLGSVGGEKKRGERKDSRLGYCLIILLEDCAKKTLKRKKKGGERKTRGRKVGGNLIFLRAR